MEMTENGVRSKVKIMSSAKCSRNDQSKAIVDRKGYTEKGEFEVDYQEIDQFA